MPSKHRYRNRNSPSTSTQKPTTDELPNHIKSYIIGITNSPTTRNKAALYQGLVNKYNNGTLDIPEKYQLSTKEKKQKQSENKDIQNRREAIQTKNYLDKFKKALEAQKINKLTINKTNFNSIGELAIEQLKAKFSPRYKKPNT